MPMISCNTIYIFVFEECLGIDSLEMLIYCLPMLCVTCSVLNKDNLLHYFVLFFGYTWKECVCFKITNLNMNAIFLFFLKTPIIIKIINGLQTVLLQRLYYVFQFAENNFLLYFPYNLDKISQGLTNVLQETQWLSNELLALIAVL